MDRRNRFEKVGDSKISGYVGTRPEVSFFLDMVPSFFADIPHALRGCFHGGFNNAVLFRFKAKGKFQRCVNIFFDILIINKGASALRHSETFIGVQITFGCPLHKLQSPNKRPNTSEATEKADGRKCRQALPAQVAKNSLSS